MKVEVTSELNATHWEKTTKVITDLKSLPHTQTSTENPPIQQLPAQFLATQKKK